jgi:two-component system sensor histidine kinase MprB
VRLDAAVRAAIERVRPRAPGVPIEANGLEPAELTGDGAALERAVVNLLDNAVKFSPPGSPVEVTLEGARIAVRDRGPGIADGDLQLVFDRFYRADGARQLPGSGLGLAIVRQVAEAHGGSAFAQHAPGGGALLVMTVDARPMTPASDPA